MNCKSSRLPSENTTIPPAAKSCAPALDEKLVCETCGQSGAYAWDGATLCLQCYTEKGSCCSESEEAG